MSSQHELIGEEIVRRLMETCGHPICSPETPGAFYQGMRLMAIDGTRFNTPDTARNDREFGRSKNQYGKGAPPEPFQAHERFEDFVVIEVRYPLPTSKEEVILALN